MGVKFQPGKIMRVKSFKERFLIISVDDKFYYTVSLQKARYELGMNDRETMESSIYVYTE